MARADQRPGRRRAVPERRARRLRPGRRTPVASGATETLPAAPAPAAPTLSPLPATTPVEGTSTVGRAAEVPEPAPPPKPERLRRWAARLLRLLWALATLAGAAALALGWTPIAHSDAVPEVGAVAVTTSFSLALAVRTGGRPVLTGLLALALGAGALVTGWPLLLSAAAVTTAAVGAVLAAVVTTPAARVPAVARECVVAFLVAVVAALAANAYDAPVSAERAGYVVLGLSLLGALGLAYRLAAGLHGLGRRGAVMLVSGIGLLAVTLAYTEALARWGSPEIVDSFESSVRGLRDLVGAVPRPTELLVGVPALAWGVSTRARRRQGWWGTGFGVAGLAVVTTSLLDHRVPLLQAGLATTYSLVLGLLLGYLVIRADSFLSGARGRRARRLEEASAHRPEPGRTHALL